MKETALTTLTALGAILVLVGASYFPFFAVYDYVLRQGGMEFLFFDPVNFQIKVTIMSLFLAGLLVAAMFLLSKACRRYSFSIFEKLLKTGTCYVAVMTLLMIVGMWADFQHIWMENPEGNLSLIGRVCFIFYSSCI